MNELTISIEAEPWFKELIDDLDGLWEEGRFTAAWTTVCFHHGIGSRILQEYPNFNRRDIYGKQIASLVSKSLGKGERTVERMIQLAQAYPDLDLLPGGKSVTIHKIYNELLPKPSEKQKEEYVLCKSCGSEIMPLKIKCQCGCEFEITKEMIRRR